MTARVRYNPARLEWATRFAYSPEVASLLRRFCGVRRGVRIVELGCGTGFWGRLLAGGAERVSLVGVDLDPGLIRRARALARRDGRANARYLVRDATRTRLPAASADLVTCHRLLCVVPDPAAVVREMVRLARPGGLVVAGDRAWDAPGYLDVTAVDSRTHRPRRASASSIVSREVA